MLGDMFVAEDRHTASSNVGIGMGLGISLGQGVAGFLGPTFGWRMPFLVVSIPALICAILFYCLVDDPERGGMEEAVRSHRQDARPLDADNDAHDGCETLSLEAAGRCDESLTSMEMRPLEYNDNIGPDRQSLGTLGRTCLRSFWNDVQKQGVTFVSLLSTSTLILSLLQGAPGCVPWGIVNTYLNDFLAVDRGMRVEYATFVVLLFGAGNFFGMLVGGHGGSYLYRQDKRFPALLAGFSAIMGCIPFWMLLNWVNSESNLWTIGPISFSSGLCSGVTGPIIKATLQNVTFPTTRGQAFALFNTFDDMGRGLGPVFVAAMISRLGGRTPAFNVGVIGWIICGVVNLCVFFTVNHDELRIQEMIRGQLGVVHTNMSEVDRARS
jgi:predicted MFS family arabinose efflux permease